MSTFNAFYVRRQASDDAIKAAIVSLYPTAGIQILPEFIGAIPSRDDLSPPEQKLKELSASLKTDVIWVTFQTTAGSFIFHRWEAGEQVRALWYACANEGTWDRVNGNAEPWEAKEFWSRVALEGLLKSVETEAERQNLKQLWKDKIIRQGQNEPEVNCEDVVRAVMEYYNLFSDGKPATAHPVAVTAGGKNKPEKEYGCLYFLLVVLALIVFALIGVSTVIKRLF